MKLEISNQKYEPKWDANFVSEIVKVKKKILMLLSNVGKNAMKQILSHTLGIGT